MQQRDSFFDVPVGFEQRGGLALQGPELVSCKQLRRAGEQEFAEQRVILVARVDVLALEREVVALIQALEQLVGAGKARQLAHVVHGHFAEQRAGGEHALSLRIERSEDLAGEIVEQHLMSRALRHALRIVQLRLLQQEHEPTGPTLRPLAQLLHLDRACALPSRQLRECSDLIDVQAQLIPTEQQQLLVEARARPFRGRRGAAQHDRREIFRQRRDPVAQSDVQRRARRHFVIVVEDQHERCLDACRQCFEIAAREHRNVRVELGPQLRQHLAIELQRVGSREAEVVEERRQIAVAAIELIPQMRNAADFEVAADERGLARSRRSAQPDERTGALVERTEQAGARQHARVARARDFGNG